MKHLNFFGTASLCILSLVACGKSDQKAVPAPAASPKPLTQEEANSKAAKRVAGQVDQDSGRPLFESTASETNSIATPANTSVKKSASDLISRDDAYAMATAREAIPMDDPAIKALKLTVKVREYYNGWFVYNDRSYNARVINFGGFHLYAQYPIPKKITEDFVKFMTGKPKSALKLAEEAYILFTLPERFGTWVDQVDSLCKSDNMKAAMAVTARLKDIEKSYPGLRNVPEDFIVRDVALRASSCLEYPKP